MSDISDSVSECELKIENEVDYLGYVPQKQVIYNKLLPYSDKLNEEIVPQLKEIKHNLSKAVVLREIRPSCLHWAAKLSRFISFYGLCFSKDDHLLFIKLFYELIIIPNQEIGITIFFAQTLNTLLSKRKVLSPDDLQLEWRPLFNLYERLFYSSHRQIKMLHVPPNTECIIKLLIRSSRVYFPYTATAEMLEEWRPKLCPFDESMIRAINFFELFLPTCLPADKADMGWKLWLDEMLGLWKTFHNGPMWESTLFWVFARLAWRNIGYIDWSPHMPLIFTRILRSFHLPVNYKKMSVQVNKLVGLDKSAIGMFLISNLGGGSDTQSNLDRLFKTLESYYHPSNVGAWTRSLVDFINVLSQYFIQRLHRERYKKDSWELKIPEKNKLTEEDITAFVKCIAAPTQLAMYSKIGCHDACVVFHHLSLVRPEIIIPPLVER